MTSAHSGNSHHVPGSGLPVRSVLLGLALHELLSRRKIVGLSLGMLGMAVLLAPAAKSVIAPE